MPIIQKMMKIACSNQEIDETRATIANSTYQKSNAILSDLQTDIQQNTRFLSDPSTMVKNELQTKAQQSANSVHGQLQAAEDLYEYNQREYQLGNVDKATLDKNKQALIKAQAQATALDTPPSSEIISATAQARAAASLNSLKQLQAAAHDVELASSQAEGCYLTASGTGIPSTATINANGEVSSAAAPTTTGTGTTETSAGQGQSSFSASAAPTTSNGRSGSRAQ